MLNKQFSMKIQLHFSLSIARPANAVRTGTLIVEY